MREAPKAKGSDKGGRKRSAKTHQTPPDPCRSGHRQAPRRPSAQGGGGSPRHPGEGADLVAGAAGFRRLPNSTG